ncbi:MAG: sensor domain-containing diguanylate cyclase [Nitrospirota bacterium]|nr:sensor domain-containing diguanylate cyclase [Nitrospirota bacterium]
MKDSSLPRKTVPELVEFQQRHEELDALRHRLEEKILELFTLYEINKALSLSTSLDELFGIAMDLLGDSLNINEYCLLMLDETAQDLVVTASHGLSEEAIRNVRFAIGEGVSGRAFITGTTMIVPDVSKEPNFLYYKGYKSDVGAFISVPLKLSDGRVIGVLNAQRAEKNSFTDFDRQLFASVAENVAIAIERTKLYEKTRAQLITDALTGIYNRRYFFEHADRELNRSVRYERPLSLIMADIDDFKCFNDTHGHLVGDEALRQTATVMQKSLRKGDILARFGGEEFIVLLPETGKEAALGVADKLREVACSVCPKNVKTGTLNPCTVTMGVASYPENGDDILKLIEEADRNLYQGKKQGKNRVVG